jgi:hypothetical protein
MIVTFFLAGLVQEKLRQEKLLITYVHSLMYLYRLVINRLRLNLLYVLLNLP